MIGFSEQRSIHGLTQAVYVFTSVLGNKLVSSGVSGGRIGSALAEVAVLVALSPASFSCEICSWTRAKTLDRKWLFVTGVVAKLNCSLSVYLNE